MKRITLAFGNIISETDALKKKTYEQLNLFSLKTSTINEDDLKELENEKKVQKVILDIKKKYGKNAILRGFDFEEGATGIERNNQIGGHKA